MDKYYYIAFLIEENEKYWAGVLRVSLCDNLVSRLDRRGIVAANICNSKKSALELATYWNKCHAENGNFIHEAKFADAIIWN